MRIIYCHHAERDVDPKKLRDQNDDITESGVKDAELVAEMLVNSHQKITAIYTSNFYRCKKTAHIINRQFNVPIIEEPRFNEIGSVEGEEWKEGLIRNIEAINDITNKYNDDSAILCVASAINLSAFICWNLDLKPNKDFPFIGSTHNCATTTFYKHSNITFREKKFDRPYIALHYKKNKDYKLITPTAGELKTDLLYELKNKAEKMEMFTNKLRREEYLSKLGELEHAQDMGEIETKKYLGNKLAIDIMQLIKDLCQAYEIEFDTVRTTTALDLNEEQCIKNMITYTERLFYLDVNIQETLMLIYSTLVSYINYNDLIYTDIEKTCIIAEEEEGSFYKGLEIYRLR